MNQLEKEIRRIVGYVIRSQEGGAGEVTAADMASVKSVIAVNSADVTSVKATVATVSAAVTSVANAVSAVSVAAAGASAAAAAVSASHTSLATAVNNISTGLGGVQLARVTTGQTLSGTGLTKISGLSLSVAAAGLYQLEGHIMWAGSAVSTVGFGLSTSAATFTHAAWRWQGNLSTVSTGGGVSAISTTVLAM